MHQPDDPGPDHDGFVECYKGWVGLCPVYAQPPEECPIIVARHRWLEWWLSANFAFQHWACWLWMQLDEDYEPEFRMKIYDELILVDAKLFDD